PVQKSRGGYVFHMGNQTKKEKLKALLKTYAAYSFTGLILSELLLYVWISIFEISVYVAPVINLIICLPINFWINKIWAFKN
ncbi:MAG TPA: GtrA family protein, partial [Candidatus Onthenecus intestinigallinarum]|nr:GtrA family protein [Candidatus Onthenecus intestinigallinarum]